MENSYLKTHYNEKLRPYTKFPYQLASMLTEKYLGSSKGKLLDVCCGRGEFMEIYESLGFEVYGVDLETVAIERGLNVKIANVDKDKLPFEDETFDFIIMKSAIEHMRNVYHVMENLTRVLKPGGKLIILTNDFRSIYRIFYDDADHKSPFTVYSIEELFLRYGYHNITSTDIFYLPFTWNSKILKLIPRIIRNLVPIDFSPRVSMRNPIVKLIKCSRETQLLGCGTKKVEGNE